MHYMTPPYIIGHASRYNTTYQSYSPQPHITNAETSTFKENNNNINVTKNTLNDDATLSQQQPIPFQRSEISQTNVNNVLNTNTNTTDISLPKEIIDEVSFYFLGDNSLLNPISNKPVEPSITPKKTSVDHNTSQLDDEHIINQLKSQINDIKKELQVEKEKSSSLQTIRQQSELENSKDKTSHTTNNDNDNNDQAGTNNKVKRERTHKNRLIYLKNI